MVSVLTVIILIIPLCLTQELSNKDILTDRLQLAALQVISFHSFNHSLNDEDFGQDISGDNETTLRRSTRSVATVSKIPHLDSTNRLIPGPELTRAQKISDVMINLKDRYAFQQSYLQKVLDSLRSAVRPNSNRVVMTSSLIRNLTVFGGVNAKQIKTLSTIIWQNSRLTVNDLKFRFRDLVTLIKAIEQRIVRLFQTTSDVVLRNRHSLITGHKRFVGHNEVSALNTTSVIVGSVGRQDLRQIMGNLYRKSRPQVIRGIKHVVKPNFVKHFLNYRLINGIDLNKQIVTTNSPQIIFSIIGFNSPLIVGKHLQIKGRFNGLKVEDLVFLNRPEVVLSPKLLTSPLIIANQVNSLTIDGLNLQKLTQSVLLSNGFPQRVNSRLIILKPLNSKNITVNGMVNHIDISLMASQLVYKNRPIVVRGKKFFILDDLHVENNLIVGKRLDGFAIPSDLLLRNRNQVIRGTKYFRGQTVFEGRVTANGFVDGLRLPQDIVTLTRNETIFGPIVFPQSIAANQDIDARRLVDGVDLSDLRQYTIKLNDKLIQSNVHFHKTVTVGAVDLYGTVNDVNLGHLMSEAIFTDNPVVNITGTKYFGSPVQMKQLFADRVNGVNLFDLLSTRQNDVVLTPKVFTSVTSIKSLDVKGLVGGVNITDLYNNRISLTKPETITGTKNFVEEIHVRGGLTVNKIDGMTPQIDFVLKSRPQHITGAKIFTKTLNANKLVSQNPTRVKGRVDNISVNELYSRVIPLNADNTFPLSVVLINCNSSHIEVFRDVNGLNMTDFAHNVMSVTQPQVVFASKHLRGEQTFFRIETSKGISGVSLSYLKENAIHLNRLTQIRAPITFTHPVVFNKPLALNGVLNGINTTYLANDAVYKNINNIISGQNVFKSGFRVNGNIHAFSFNGMDLSNELFTKTRDHVLKRNVKFTRNVHINGDIGLNGRINGLDLSEFNERVMKINTRNIIAGNLELIGSTKVMTNINIEGRLNGINMTHLFNDAVFVNSNQEITGVKTIIAPVHVLGHLNTTSLNNMNVPHLLRDIVYINSINEQYISAPKVFTNDISMFGLAQSNGVAIMGPINGINLQKLDVETIKINRATNLRTVKNFKDFVIIANNWTQIMGRINEVDLMRDAILLHSNNGEPQVISGRKVFDRLILNDNAIVNGRVNGFPLKDIQMNTFFISNDQRITGHKIFRGLLELSSPYNSVRFLNGLRFPEDFITLNGNQNVSALLTFNNPLIVNRNLFVRGDVSNTNLTQLATQSLLRDRPQVLSQPITFESIIFRRDVNVDQHVDNVDLSSLSNKVKQFTSVANITKDLLVVKGNRHHYVSDYLFSSLEKSLFEIDFFNLYQNLDEVHGNRIQVFDNNVFTISETIGSPPKSFAIKYNTNSELFETSLVNPNNNVFHKTFILNGEEFITHWSPHSYNYSAHITRSGQLVAPIGHFISSVEVLKINPTNAVLVSYQSNTGKLLVHSLEMVANKPRFTQITEALVGTDTSKVVTFLRQNQIYVVVAKHYGLNCVTDSSGTLVLVLRNFRSLELIQTIPIVSVEDMVHFSDYGRHYLAISDGSSAKQPIHDQTIHIYRSEFFQHKCSFSLFQTLSFDNAIQLSAFTYGTMHSIHNYLMAFNTSNIIIWKQRGESGFSQNWLLDTKSATAVLPVMAANKLFLIVSQSYKCHESMIFRAETRGIELAPIVFHTKYN